MTGIAKRILAGVGSVFVEIPTFETSPYQNGGGGFRQDYRNLKSDIAAVCKDASPCKRHSSGTAKMPEKPKRNN